MATRLLKSGWGGDCVITDPSTSAKRSTFLIVSLRYLGDVLVTTPLAYSIKQQFPNAVVDYLVFAGTEAVLAKNPYVDTVHTMTRRDPVTVTLRRFWKRYDVAIAANPSDRTVFMALVAGKRPAGLVYNTPSQWWKRLLLSRWVFCNDWKHVVPVTLSLLPKLDVSPKARVVVGYDRDDSDFVGAFLPYGGYVILHPYSRNRCKYWTAEKWGELAWLIVERLSVQPVFTRTPAVEDREFLEEILRHAPNTTAAFPDACTLNQLAAAIAGSRGYVGIDTVATHIAASVNVPTVAIFGPTLTRYWAPWPNDCDDPSPFSAKRGVQRVGNVTVVQKDWECVPCNRETCSRTGGGEMACLAELTPEEVLAALMSAE